MASKDRLQKEVNTVVEKWHMHSLIESAYSLQLRDFVFVNIDTEDKLSIVVLGQDSIRKKGSSFNLYRLVLSFPEAKAGCERGKQGSLEATSLDLKTKYKRKLEGWGSGQSDKAGADNTKHSKRQLSGTLCVQREETPHRWQIPVRLTLVEHL